MLERLRTAGLNFTAEQQSTATDSPWSGKRVVITGSWEKYSRIRANNNLERIVPDIDIVGLRFSQYRARQSLGSCLEDTAAATKYKNECHSPTVLIEKIIVSFTHGLEDHVLDS